jgi:uncharacterized oligopeptide transporter (OPT) family protein
MIAGAAANQTTDMVGDLRAGHLLGASPANQFYSQFIGSFFAIVLAPSLFVLFSQVSCEVRTISQDVRTSF